MTVATSLRSELTELQAYSVPGDPAPIKLDANESPWPLPPALRERIARALADLPLHRYPDPRATELRARLAASLGARPEELVIGSGSDEVIALLCTALSRPRPGAYRASVLIPVPTFVMYRITALAHGLHPVSVPLDEAFQLDVPAMRAALDEHRPALCFLATPNNPTGNAYRDVAIRSLIEASPDTLFVIDEAYAAFAGRSLSSWVDAYPNVALLGTLSKVGLAAARVGWARLPQPLAREVDKVRQPFNVSALSQSVAALALGELRAELDAHVAAVVAERARLAEALPLLPGLHVYPTAANFFLVRVERDPEALVAALRFSGIAVRSFHAQGGRLARHLRITVGTPTENDALLEALTRHLVG
jgi:histidinol-phosphate aminotransferase